MRTAPIPVVPEVRPAGNELPGMPLGLGVSGGAHVAAILLVLFGGELFVARSPHQFQVTEVSLVSVSEFGALLSEAPDIPATEAHAATQPDAAEELRPPQLPVARPVQRPEPATVPTAAPPPPEPVSPTTVAALADSESPIPESPIGVAPHQPAIPEVSLRAPRPEARAVPEAGPPPEPVNPAVVTTLAEPSPPVPQVWQEAETRQPARPEAPPAVRRPEARAVPEAVPPPEPARPAVVAALAEPSPPAPQQVALARQPAIPDSLPEAPTPELRTAPEVPPAPSTAPVPVPVSAPAPERKPEATLASALSAILQSGAAPVQGPAAASGFAIRRGLSASEYEYLRRQIGSCWNPITVVGGRNAYELQVTLQVDFTQDGHLRSTPVLVEPNPLPSEHHNRAYQAANSALQRCAPYERLPRDEFARWRRLKFTFDPRGMVEGAR